MPKKRRKLNVVCLNSSCKSYNKKGYNIVKNGTKPSGQKNYLCRDCCVAFVGSKGTIFYHKKLKKNDVAEIARHIVETNSLRGIARETKHNKNTICDFTSLIAKHCAEFNDILIKDVKLGVHEIDELWSFVKKNKKKLPTNFSRTLNKVMRMHTST